MNTNRKIAYAVSAILSAYRGGSYAAAAEVDTAATKTSGLEEIVVTAQRRNESIQDVPITIQALSGDQLRQLNVFTFDGLLKYMPNVTNFEAGPGMGEIYMRGLSGGSSPNQGSASTNPFPNVAVYLDDQSMEFPGRNVDVYMVDMERVEVLEGPQGTLFGGGAEAGAIRYITNKPKLNVTEGDVEASYGTTAGGDPNTSANATINLPLIADKLAVRATIFNDRRGGYVDNVPSTVSLSVSPAPVPPPPVTNNNDFIASNTNPLTYTGARLSGLYWLNDDWSLLVAQSYQNLQADGYFAQYPIGSAGEALGRDQITAFEPAYDKDRYESTAWTVNGKVDDWKLVYTGSYLDRHVEQQIDYTNYLRTGGGTYYTCTGGAGTGYLGSGAYPSSQALTCYAPHGFLFDTTQAKHQSHEFRLSTPDDKRLRGIFGAFWEKMDIADQQDFNYLDVPQCTPANLAIANAGGPACVSAVGPVPGAPTTKPGLRGSSTAFGEDIQRGFTQTAFFGSMDFDLIPKVLTLTAGTRHYQYKEYEKGSQWATSTGCVDVPNGTCLGSAIDKRVTFSGFRSRANLTWHINPDTMVYYTWSQGFRPGALNRTQSNVANFSATAPTLPQFRKPSDFAPDTLTNNELGLKSELLHHRLQVNLSVYDMKWQDIQMTFFNPLALGNTSFAINGPDYTVKGVELQLVGRVTDGLTLQGSGSWNSANQSTSPCLVSNIPTSPSFGQCITTVKGAPFENPFGALDTRPAFSPPLEFNARARYDWSVNEYKAFMMVGASHVSHMVNQPATYPEGDVPGEAIPTTTRLKYDQPGYTTYDAAIGVSKDSWTAQLSGNNLTNSNASTYTGSPQFIKEEVPLRPRVLTLQVGYKF